jgi:integrase
MKRRHLTDVTSLPRKTKRYSYADPELIGLHFRIPPRKSRAPVSFAVIVGKKWVTLGNSDNLSLAEAREKARRVRSGRSSGKTVSEVAREWVRWKLKGMRTARERERIVEKNIVPIIGHIVMSDLRLEDINAMLDPIEEQSGAQMRDQVLRVFGAIARWHQTREQGYLAPVTRGMWRVTKRDRERFLSDDEIRAIWSADGGRFGAMVRFALVTCQRREKVRTIRWDDVKDGVWTIRKEDREKGVPPQLALPKLALDILEAQRQTKLGDYVFSSPRGGGPIGTSGYHKAEFDKVCGVEGFRVHDLRRSGRTLMSRAGVLPHVGEAVLGHSLRGVHKVYDRFAYVNEMADALEKLAALIKQITSSA